MRLDRFFNGNDMFPSSPEFAAYLGFPFYELPKEDTHKEKYENSLNSVYDFS